MLLVPGEMFGLGKGLRFGFGFDIEHTMKGLSRVDDVLAERRGRPVNRVRLGAAGPPRVPRLPRRGVGRARARRRPPVRDAHARRRTGRACWSTILNKREGYRQRVRRLRPREGRPVHAREGRAPAGRPRIVRNRLKVESDREQRPRRLEVQRRARLARRLPLDVRRRRADREPVAPLGEHPRRDRTSPGRCRRT